MPSNWATIDQNFPTFTGEESPEQQIRALRNYLFQLREGMQYSLQNLTAENFNATALQKLTDDQKNEVTEELQKVYALMNQLSGRLDSLSGRVTGIENLAGRVTAAEGEITDLKGRVALTEGNADDLGKRISAAEKDAEDIKNSVAEAEKNVDALGDRVSKLEKTVTEDGGLSDRMDYAEQELQKIAEVVTGTEDGSATVGAEGKPLYLVGDIYINGVLYEQGDST